MIVLMLSTDGNIFINGSEVQRRMTDYGGLVEELHIVVKSQISNLKSQNFGNVFIYPADGYIDLFKIGGKIISRFSDASTLQLLVTSQDPFELGLVGYLLKKKFNLPLQLQMHTDFLSPYFGKESVRNKLRVILGKRLAKKADGVRAVSERIKNSLMANGHAPVSVFVLPIFIDTRRIQESPVNVDLHQKYPDRFIILMASRLTREKNIGLAVKAIKNLVSDHPNILLLVVGSGPERENLKSQISNLKLEDNTIIEDWRDDLSSYYKTADLFLLTSNYEGYGRTVVEATAAGLPVLMTDVGVAIGSVVPVGDKKALVDKLDLLVRDPLARGKILKNQEKSMGFYDSKEDYLNRIKESWSQCL